MRVAPPQAGLGPASFVPFILVLLGTSLFVVFRMPETFNQVGKHVPNENPQLTVFVQLHCALFDARLGIGFVVLRCV